MIISSSKRKFETKRFTTEQMLWIKKEQKKKMMMWGSFGFMTSIASRIRPWFLMSEVRTLTPLFASLEFSVSSTPAEILFKNKMLYSFLYSIILNTDNVRSGRMRRAAAGGGHASQRRATLSRFAWPNLLIFCHFQLLLCPVSFTNPLPPSFPENGSKLE